MTFSFNRLNCVLRAGDAAHIDAVTNWLRVSARVGEVTTCTNDTEFKDELQDRIASHSIDFVIVVVSGDELPPHLLRYPDLKILVLTTRRKIGSLTPWLQQGACDVASLSRPQQVQHALSRLIDECATARQVDLLATELLRSEARNGTLVRNSRTPLSFWRDNELLACSPGFSAITGMVEGSSTDEWLDNLSTESASQLGPDLDHWPAHFRADICDQDQAIRIHREVACEGFDDNEHLFSVKLVMAGEPVKPQMTTHKKSAKTAQKQPQKSPRARNGKRAVKPTAGRFAKIPILTNAVTPTNTEALSNGRVYGGNNGRINGGSNGHLDVPLDGLIEGPTDSVSGLPARQTVINSFQQWLQAAKSNSRYVAMAVDLSDSGISEYTKSNTNETALAGSDDSQAVEAAMSAIDRTMQDLAVYRAADRLSRTLSSNTLLGRLNKDCLVIIRKLEADEAPRMLAKGIRKSLGSLGGLIGSPDAVRINTVNISAQSGASAEGLVTRLENR